MRGGDRTGYLISMTPFLIFAAALFIIGTLVTLFIRTPHKNEIVSDKNHQETAPTTKSKFAGWTGKEVLKMKWFWIFSVGFLIIGLGLASLNEDYAAFLDTKLSLKDVGLIGAMYGIGCLIGNIWGGYLFDKLGTAKAMTFAGIMYVISIIMMILVSFQPYGTNFSRYAGYGYAIFCGLAVFSYMSGPAFMAKDLFGSKDQGVMLGYVGIAYAIGFAIGAPLFGIIKKFTSFTVAWYFMLAFVVIGFILLIFAVIKIKQLQKEIIKANNLKTASANK